MRLRSLILIALVAISIEAAPRRRAVSKPTIDPSTIDGWLIANTHLLVADEYIPYDLDLEPLRTMIGSATIVGLGDGTHGTHQFFTMKMRIIDFLAREEGFDVVAFEGPFPLMNRMDAYVQGGAGNARELASAMKPLAYLFWNSEEMVQLLEWMRQYNATRGDRPALRIAGFDIFEPYPASREVLTYLRDVDPPAAATAESLYACITPSAFVVTGPCNDSAVTVLQALTPKEAAYTALTSAAAYAEAQQYARVVTQAVEGGGPNRDAGMAANALWLRANRSATHKIILWAHNAHLSKTSTELAPYTVMGQTLSASLAGDYFNVATLTAAGAIRQWQPGSRTPILTTIPALTPANLESDLRKRDAPRFIIPLRGDVPEWLSRKRPYITAGTYGNPQSTDSITTQFDAAIFIDTTSPITDLP
ncbi:MAG TPA: erythromycin esterase family protein [Thermoanaerobaculia bacterium]